jgi:hypothetical protein
MSIVQYSNAMYALRFIADWQAERMYSEEQMHNLMDEYQDWLYKTDDVVKTFKEWFGNLKEIK